MSLSPHGSSALITGSLRKGLPVMLLGGVLAWVSGQSWSVERGSGEVFQLGMVYATLIAIAVPAQLICGPRGKPWMLATTGAVGLTVPFFWGLALTQQGQGVVVPTLLVLASSWVLTYTVSWMTRRVVARRPRGSR